ncbi:MAG: helix-turn-helix domain-containing protein [Actinomycetota bacterium]|jgi:excisionase family DNA binding protein
MASPNERNNSDYMRTSEVARLLHVSPKTVSRWAKEDKIPHVRTLGGHRRFPAHEIRELAARLMGRPAD